MSAERRIAAYLELADRGLRSAGVLLRERQVEDAALFMQQVVERVARALLTQAGVPFGTSHNPGQMAAALPDDHPFKARINTFDDLSTAVTNFRYPTPSGRLAKAPEPNVLARRLAEVEQLLRDATVFATGSSSPGGNPAKAG